MNITDRKELFLAYNNIRYRRFFNKLKLEQKKAIHVLPLMLHVNINLLPGYISNRTPFGIYDYMPDEKAVRFATQFNEQISFNTEANLVSWDIEAVYLQEDIATNKLMFWVLHDVGLDESKVNLLRQKVKILTGWLRKINLDIEYRVSTPESISNNYYGVSAGAFNPDRSFFLDKFYAEIIVIAGKYPAWWLLPPEKESIYVDYMVEVGEKYKSIADECIDFGSLSLLRPQDYLSAALWYLYNAKSLPESSWLNLLSLRHRFMSFPRIDNIATRLKSNMIENYDDLEDVNEKGIFIGLINEDINSGATKYDDRLDKLLVTISSYWSKQTNQLTNYSVFTQLLLWRTNADNKSFVVNAGVDDFIESRKVLLHLITEIYKWIVARVYEQDSSLVDRLSLMQSVSENLLSHIGIFEDKLPVINAHVVPEFYLDKICLVENSDVDESNKWILARPSRSDDLIEIYSAESIVGALVWAWVNRLIDSSTQISVRCRSGFIRQTEVNDLLADVIQDIPNDFACNVSLDDFTNKEQNLRSIIYIHVDGKEEVGFGVDVGSSIDSNFIESECIALSSWGESRYQYLYGLDALVFYMADWLNEALLNDNERPSAFVIKSLKSGLSNYISLQVRDIYDEVFRYFYSQVHMKSSYVFRCLDRYYLLAYENSKLGCKVLGDKKSLYKYFEHKQSFSKNLSLSFNSFNNTPLLEMLRLNKPGLIQLFYLPNYDFVDVYIIDENSSLYYHTQAFMDDKSFVNQWNNFFDNAQSHLQEFVSSDKEELKIEIGRLVLDHRNQYRYIEDEAHISSNYGNYFNLKVVIDGKEDNRALTLHCDDRSFSSNNYGGGIFREFMSYVLQQRKNTGDIPVYLTDIEAPLELFENEKDEEINVYSFLKYKINIENRLSVISKRDYKH